MQEETEGGMQALSPLIEDLRKHKIEVAIEQDVLEEAKDTDATLYITDSGICCRMLKEMGRYVLPYLHGKNCEESFAGAKYLIEKIEETDYETIDMAYRRAAGLPWDILETARCVVRETKIEDVDSFYEIYAEPSITEYTEDLYADREEEIAYTADYIEKVYGFYGYGMWTVLEKQSGKIIGRAGISWREGFGVPELGFVIGVPWQRQGYAYEVCSAILSYAKEELGITKVQALVMKGNTKSENLCRKLGFSAGGEVVLEGERYTLYRDFENSFDT